MTVAELIEMLKEMPQDMEIRNRNEYYRYFQGKTETVREIEVIFFMGPEKDEEEEE